MIRSSWAWKSSCRSSAATASASSAGRCWSASQQRPLIPNRSAAGQRGTRLRCRIACTWFFNRVRCRTMCARRATCRRSACVACVGHPHRRQIVGRQQLRQHLGVDLVGLDLRLGDRPRLHRVGHHHPRHPRLAAAVTIACVLHVASIATSSSGPRLSANIRSASAVRPICPAWLTTPSCQIATCANSRCTSSPIHRASHHSPPQLIDDRWEPGGRTTPTDPRSTAHPGKSQGRPSTNTGSKPIEQTRPAQPAFAPGCPVPDGRTVLTNPDAHNSCNASRRRGGICCLSYRPPTP